MCGVSGAPGAAEFIGVQEHAPTKLISQVHRLGTNGFERFALLDTHRLRTKKRLVDIANKLIRCPLRDVASADGLKISHANTAHGVCNR